MKRYAVCITDDDGGTGEAVFTVKNKTEARARGRLYIRQWQLPNGKIEYMQHRLVQLLPSGGEVLCRSGRRGAGLCNLRRAGKIARSFFLE